jgi:glyoxylase-like metal-dependent hydrolase (beta-lactamase superfamily II)
VVPRALWAKKKPPDERNRIRMTANCLLVERGGDLLLVDTGVGDKGDAKFVDQYAVGGTVRLPEAIRRAGYEPGDVTHVLLTHLHFDHSGWNTRDEGGRLVPTFPRARYWLQRGEVEHARRPNLRDRASYDPRNWEPLFAAGVVELFGEQVEPVPGVTAVRTPGHNADLSIVLLDGGSGHRAAFWSDLVPTAAHVPFPWIMSYDLYPMETLAAKELWLPRAAAGGWLSIFEHDPELPLARLGSDERGRLVPQPLEPEGRGRLCKACGST